MTKLTDTQLFDWTWKQPKQMIQNIRNKCFSLKTSRTRWHSFTYCSERKNIFPEQNFLQKISSFIFKWISLVHSMPALINLWKFYTKYGHSLMPHSTFKSTSNVTRFLQFKLFICYPLESVYWINSKGRRPWIKAIMQRKGCLRADLHWWNKNEDGVEYVALCSMFLKY